MTSNFEKIENLAAKYFDLLYFADTGLIDECFFAEAGVYSIEQDQLVSIDMAGFATRISSRQAPSSIDEPRNDVIKMIEIESPTTALLKVEVNILGDRYHDYLILMKRDNQWKIITKAFHRFAK